MLLLLLVLQGCTLRPFPAAVAVSCTSAKQHHRLLLPLLFLQGCILQPFPAAVAAAHSNCALLALKTGPLSHGPHCDSTPPKRQILLLLLLPLQGFTLQPSPAARPLFSFDAGLLPHAPPCGSSHPHVLLLLLLQGCILQPSVAAGNKARPLLAFDAGLLSHAPPCDSSHPERPERAAAVVSRLMATGLAQQCKRVSVNRTCLQLLQYDTLIMVCGCPLLRWGTGPIALVLWLMGNL